MKLNKKDKEDHHELLTAKIKEWKRRRLLCNSSCHGDIELVHVCYVMGIYDEDDLSYFDFPFDQPADEFNAYLSSEEGKASLETVNKDVFQFLNDCYKAEPNDEGGYLYYSYQFDEDDRSFRLEDYRYRPNTELDEATVKSYLPILDASMFLTNNYKCSVQVGRAEGIQQKTVLSIGGWLREKKDDTFITCSYVVNNVETVSSNLEDVVADLYRSDFYMLRQFFDSPATPVITQAVRNEVKLKNDLILYRERIGSFGHSVWGKMSSAKALLRKIDRQTKDAEVNDLVLKLKSRFDIMSMVVEGMAEGRLEDFKNRSIESVLGYLTESGKTAGLTIVPEYLGEKSRFLIPIAADQHTSHFLVFWNLLENAINATAKCRSLNRIGLHQIDNDTLRPNRKSETPINSVSLTCYGNRYISFENDGEIPNLIVDFLLSTRTRREGRSGREFRLSGLEIVKEEMLRLGWTIDSVTTGDGRTKIVIDLIN